MSVREYIGARYVPLFDGEWDSTKNYEPLTIVLHEGNSYTSRQYVPVGIAITNEDFWALTGNYNGQIEQYRRDVSALTSELADVKSMYVKGYNTVADMTVDIDYLTPGLVCHTNGFHTAGDGGAAWYVISSTGTANGMDVIACGDLFANLVIESEVSPEMFGAYGDGEHDDTLQCQRALDISSIVNFGNHYLVSKGDVSKYGDSASCLMLNDNQHIHGVGTIHSNVHGQGVIGIDGKNNVTVEGVTLKGYGQFPILDGTTGRGEKGTSAQGYNTSGFWYYHFNNSYDTSARTDHTSYGTGAPWGTFGNGGFFGNIGSGILVTGASENIFIDKVKASGFNGAGITVGHYGDTALRKNVKITDCILHGNYSAGIDMYNYSGLLIDGCTIYDIGHPDALPTDTYQDPGYGTACSISDSAKKTIISNNNIHDCVRKGIDAHGVDTVIITGNEIDDVGQSVSTWRAMEVHHSCAKL